MRWLGRKKMVMTTRLLLLRRWAVLDGVGRRWQARESAGKMVAAMMGPRLVPMATMAKRQRATIQWGNDAMMQ